MRRAVLSSKSGRAVGVLVVAGIAAAALLEGFEGEQSREESGRSSRSVHARDAAACPPSTVLAPPPPSERELARARSGRFDVVGPRPVRFVPPVDWRLDPLGSQLYRQNVHKLRFLRPLLGAYAGSRDREALSQAIALALDWVRQNPPGGRRTAADAWLDKIAGDRVSILSYVIRAAACEDLLEPAERRDLLASMRQHGQFLVKHTASDQQDNHVLFTDLGLLRLTRQFPFLGDAARWRGRATRQFRKTLHGRLAGAVWLEHSTEYQFLVIRALEEFLRLGADDPTLERILSRMRSVAAWFVRPDARTTQFGDSYLKPAPGWAVREAASQHGAGAFLDAGYYFVRGGGGGRRAGYLAVTAGFHNVTHKHADELSFDLYDDGVPLVTDTGLYDKDPGPVRDFVLSAAAHSTLTVDGAGFPTWNRNETYGSGLVANGRGRGWFAVEGRNPLLRTQGVRHRRLFLYRPGEVLLIVDWLRSRGSHTYARHLQLAPGIRAIAVDRDRLALRRHGLRGWVTDGPVGAPARREVLRGQRHPFAGFSSPSFRRLIPRNTVVYEDDAADEVKALAISLTAAPATVSSAQASPGGWQVRVRASDGTSELLTIVRRGRRLRVR